MGICWLYRPIFTKQLDNMYIDNLIQDFAQKSKAMEMHSTIVAYVHCIWKMLGTGRSVGAIGRGLFLTVDNKSNRLQFIHQVTFDLLMHPL
jgi:hypothetical protein